MERKNEQQVYDLEERTAKFAQDIIEFCKTIPQTVITKPMITQIIRSGTSQAANYFEANEAESPKDFAHKIGICKKEIKETKLWIRLLVHAYEPVKKQSETLMNEAHQLNLIFAAIRRKTNNNLKIEN